MACRQSGDLFNIANVRVKTKTTRILMRELLFEDDSAQVAHSAEEMQKIVDALSDASKTFGLKFNIKKIEVLYPHKSTRTREEDTMVDGNKLNSVLEFTYLGSTISSNGCIDDEIQPRLVHSSADNARDSGTTTMCSCGLRQDIPCNRAVNPPMQSRELDSVQTTGEKLHAVMMRHLRSIIRITWMDKVRKKDIHERTGLEDLLIMKNSVGRNTS